MEEKENKPKKVAPLNRNKPAPTQNVSRTKTTFTGEKIGVIHMTAVNSSNVESIGYNKAERILLVKYKGGTVYKYSDIPEDVYTKMKSVDSIGRYISQVIKNNTDYKYEVLKQDNNTTNEQRTEQQDKVVDKTEEDSKSSKGIYGGQG